MESQDDWFSAFSNKLIEIGKAKVKHEPELVRQYLADCMRLGQGSIDTEISGLALTVKEALDELPWLDDTDPTPILTYLFLVGALLECERDNKQKEKSDLAYSCGLIWGELRAKWQWERPARSGKAALQGAEGTRKATDAERFGIVARIIQEEGVSQSKAFEIAEERHRDIGAEASFRTSYFKHRKFLGNRAV